MRPNLEQNERYIIKKQDINRLIKRFKNSIHISNLEVDKKTDVCGELYEKENLIENIKLAKLEWIDANKNFEFAYDKEIIDYYTYQIKASETRYQYLLKLAREKAITLGAKESARYIIGENAISS